MALQASFDDLGTHLSQVTFCVVDLETTGGAETDMASPRYQGEGVYVGHEPPEGFTIKGNERSMKYHVPESSGYGRTVAEVWFNSEDAAQQAGFVRAQR